MGATMSVRNDPMRGQDSYCSTTHGYDIVAMTPVVIRSLSCVGLDIQLRRFHLMAQQGSHFGTPVNTFFLPSGVDRECVL